MRRWGGRWRPWVACPGPGACSAGVLRRDTVILCLNILKLSRAGGTCCARLAGGLRHAVGGAGARSEPATELRERAQKLDAPAEEHTAARKAEGLQPPRTAPRGGAPRERHTAAALAGARGARRRLVRVNLGLAGFATPGTAVRRLAGTPPSVSLTPGGKSRVVCCFQQIKLWMQGKGARHKHYLRLRVPGLPAAAHGAGAWWGGKSLTPGSWSLASPCWASAAGLRQGLRTFAHL